MKTLRDYINLIETAQNPVTEDQATRTCPQCDGSGEDTLDPTKSCRRCGGKGHIPMSPREQGVTEDLIDHDAAEPLARHFAELYYNGLSSADEAKMAARVYQQVVDGEMSIEQLKQHIAKLEKEKGVAEGAKVDRQAKHITASMMKKGKSKKDAEAIAWAHIKHPKKKAKEGWTHDSLADQLFEHERTYEEQLQNKLNKQLGK